MANFEMGENIYGRVGTTQTDTKKPFGVDKQQEVKPTEDQQEYLTKAQGMLDSYKKFFATFADDRSLRFKVGFGNGFFTDLDTGVVNIDGKWFIEQGYSLRKIQWAVLHELGHFLDLAGDVEGMKRNHANKVKQAKKTGAVMMKKWVDKFGSTNPELIKKLQESQKIDKKSPPTVLNPVEQAGLRIHHMFDNILMDIYVNHLVARKAPLFDKDGEGYKDVQEVYAQKLFPKTDFTDSPRHLQFLYALLRETMVPDEKVTVTPEVQEALERRVGFIGKKTSPKEIVEKFILPKKGRDTKLSTRDLAIQVAIEPIFLELLMKDLDDWDPQEPQQMEGGEGGEGEDQTGQDGNQGENKDQQQKEQEPQSGGGSSFDVNPFNKEYNEYEENSPDQMNDDKTEDWAEKDAGDQKKAAEKKKNEEIEEHKSAAQKAQEAQQRLDTEWCKKHEVNMRALHEYRKTEEEISPYLEDLSNLWRRIIFGKSRQSSSSIEGFFKYGELDIPKTIQEWPSISEGQFSEVEVMKKRVISEQLVPQPELFRVRLVGDASGSMSYERRKVLKQVYVLLSSSLREFNTYLNLTRSQTKSKLRVDTQIWAFGSQVKLLKNFREGEDFDDEQADAIKAFDALNLDLGGTSDELAYQSINQDLTPEDREKIERKKVMEMLFFITDGGSNNPKDARKGLDEILDTGIIARGFQIGQVSTEEKRIFEEVWNGGREEKIGEVVGSDLGNLLPAVTELLKKYIGSVKL